MAMTDQVKAQIPALAIDDLQVSFSVEGGRVQAVRGYL